jgi:hypothetical protein
MTNNINDNNEYIYLNGPVNYVKLRNGNKKVLLFFDIHEELYKQKRCDNFDSKDVDKYIYKILKEAKEPIDFFMEIEPTDVQTQQKIYDYDKYIRELRKVFRKLYKELENKPNVNIRLHYMDIRDYSFFWEMYLKLQEQYKLLYNIYNNLQGVIDNFNSIIKMLQFIQDTANKIEKNDISDLPKINYISTSLVSDSKIEENLDKNQIMDIGLIRIIKKIMKEYSNDYNKKIINNLFTNKYLLKSEYVIKYIIKTVKMIDDVKSIFQNSQENEILVKQKYIIDSENNIYNNNYGYRLPASDYYSYYRAIQDQIEIIREMVSTLGCIIMDCYFLRRIIEKSDILNAVVWSGATHSITYLWFLVKFCDYHIEEYNYINLDILTQKDPVKQFEEIIKNTDDFVDLVNLIMPKKFNQCVKMKNNV